MDRHDTFILGLLLGLIFAIGTLILVPAPTQIKYIYDTESIGHGATSARLVGFCNGEYLIRTDSIGRDAPSEDEFPKSGCMFIEPITLGSEADVL